MVATPTDLWYQKAKRLTCRGLDHDAALDDRLAGFILGPALVLARIGGTIEGAHDQLGTSSARGIPIKQDLSYIL